MHLVDVSVGAMPSNAIVGANIPIATGAAIGFRLRGLDCVAVSFFGDGAANIGTFHEGINLAAVRKAPAVFVCENNLYAASTHMSLTTGIIDIAERAKSYRCTAQRPGPSVARGKVKGRCSWSTRPIVTRDTPEEIRGIIATSKRWRDGAVAIPSIGSEPS
jgi:hypothetical protein